MTTVNLPHLATLARLTISPDQVESFQNDLEHIIAMVEHLPELPDIPAVLDDAHPMTLRPDCPEPSLPREELLQHAPAVKAGCVLVPKVVD